MRLPGMNFCRAVAVYKYMNVLPESFRVYIRFERSAHREHQKKDHSQPDHNFTPADCRGVRIRCILFHRAFFTGIHGKWL